MILRKNDKIDLKLTFLDRAEVENELNELLRHYEADSSLANLDKARTTLRRFVPVCDDGMRKEYR